MKTLEKETNQNEGFIELRNTILNNRANTYIKLFQYKEALSDLNILLSNEPKNIKGLFRRGFAYYKISNFRDALCGNFFLTYT